MFRTFVFVLAALMSCPLVAAAQATQPARATTSPSAGPAAAAAHVAATTNDVAIPAASQPRVLVISIDGLRPDLLLRARAPYLREMFESGSYSFWARTVPHAITLPSHVSMMTGVVPRRHQIEWNNDLQLAKPFYPKSPTLFAAAKRAGYTTAITAGKMKFSALCEPGTVDWQFIPNSSTCEDGDVVERATQIIRSHRPQVMTIHLPSVDNVGHAVGWGTPEQMATIERADGYVGMILAALREAGVREQTFIILTADHGGAGKTHLADDARARHIPWIITGPGIRRGLDLTIYPQLVINTEDTFATACRLLKIPLDPRLDGKPIEVVLESPGELMTAVRAE